MNYRFIAALLKLALLPTAAAAHYPAIPVDLTTPVQQRIAFRGPQGKQKFHSLVLVAYLPILGFENLLTFSAVAIGWNTYQKLNQSCVQYGLSEDDLSLKRCSSASATYHTSRTYSNAVTLNGLSPATTYYYQIVSSNSSVQQFFSPREAGDDTAFTMAVVIDLGVYGQDGYTIKMDMTKRDTIPGVAPALNHTTIGRLADTIDDYEFVIHPGDLAYADDWVYNVDNFLDASDAYESIIENFYSQLAPIASRKPYMASPGNHEADCEEVVNEICPTGQKNFTDFMNRFGQTMPTAFSSTSSNKAAVAKSLTAQSLAKPPFWYSFEYGMVHVTMIDTETDFENAPDGPGTTLNSGPFGRLNQQLEFLEADLASVDRSITPWVIVGGHRPWYSTGSATSMSTCSACQIAFESLMYKYGVDMGVFGHVHNSQRFLPLNNTVIDPNGMNDPKAPMYIVAGGPGNIEGLSAVGDNKTGNVFAYADDYSYATVTFLDAQHMQTDFYQSSTGQLLDSSVLFKSHNTSFVIQ